MAACINPSSQKLVDLNNNPSQLYKMPVHEYMDLYVKDKIL